MKRIMVDGDLCQGSGECAAIAPSLIVFDESGVAQVVPSSDDGVADDIAERLVAICPSMAVSLIR
jgi:ferredoxin